MCIIFLNAVVTTVVSQEGFWFKSRRAQRLPVSVAPRQQAGETPGNHYTHIHT